MSILTRGGLVAAMASVLLVSGAAAQQQQRPGQLTLFSQIGFRGRAFTVTGPRNNLRLGWTVRSARVARGDAWDVCTQANFRGRCQRIAETVANVGFTVGSARPSEVVTLPEPGPNTGFAPADNRSLRGMAAEFFPRPSERDRRVLSCDSGAAACARDSANRFCRTRGWTAATYHRQETIGRNNYLADVLCTRTG